MALDLSGFRVDHQPNQALFKIADTITENKRYNEERAYRNQKNEEADEWRKLNLVQDLTDLSKHQTSSDVANAVGNQKAADILQKYTVGAKFMSPAELQAKITQDMSGLIGAMDAMKNELDISDQTLKLLKQQYPELDVVRLAQEHRADILKRRMDANLEFVNPMTVAPPSMDLSDPEFLADYTTGNKNLVTSITDPKGTEQESVLMGKQGDYTKFEGKLPFWKQPSYDRSKFNSEGFYTEREIPSFKVKSSTIPTDALPASNGKPFEVVDKDVYDRFAQDQNSNLELIAATKKAFPTYSKFSPQEKEYAKRNVLLGMLNTYDQSQLHPTSNVRPQKTSVHVNTGNKTPTPIDLTEQPDVGGGFKDITSMMGGVKTSILPDGKSFNAKLVYFNPATQKVKYIEHVSKDDEGSYGGAPQWKEVSLTKFKQDVKTNNPATDMNFLEGLKNPIVGAKQEPKPTANGGYTDISTGTYKGQKGVKIGKKNGKWYNIDTGEELK